MSRLQNDAARLRRALYAAGRTEGPSAAARRATLLALAAAEANAKVPLAGAGRAKPSTTDLPRAGNPGWTLASGLVGVAALAGLVFGVSEGVLSERSPAPEVAAQVAIATTTETRAPTSPTELPSQTAPNAALSAAVALESLPKHTPPVGATHLERAPVQTPTVAAVPQPPLQTRTSSQSGVATSAPLDAGVTSAEAPHPALSPAPSLAVGTTGWGQDDSPRRASNSALAEEVRRMEAIRRELRTGRASEAMRLLAEYRIDYPAGALADEAVVLQIECLIRLGRKEEAALLARRFLAESPRSPYSTRVNSLLSSVGDVHTSDNAGSLP
jgi:hypothetical protein